MVLARSMWDTTQYLCKHIEGCKVGYTQSDEIMLLLVDYTNLDTQAWFDKNINKMVSVSASMATLAFNEAFRKHVEEFALEEDTNLENVNTYITYLQRVGTALFDSRAYNIPKEEVCNAFIWRQQDATRNAIEAVGQANFSHKELQGKNCNIIQEMLFAEKDINFNDFPTYQKRGTCIVKETYMKSEVERARWIVDHNIPIFTQDRTYIDKYL